MVLEITFSCLLCSRMFLKDRPYGGEVPFHLDPLLGNPCPGSGAPLDGFLEIPPPPSHEPFPEDWPRFEPYGWSTRRPPPLRRPQRPEP